jgi:hypothetical protein
MHPSRLRGRKRGKEVVPYATIFKHSEYSRIKCPLLLQRCDSPIGIGKGELIGETRFFSDRQRAIPILFFSLIDHLHRLPVRDMPGLSFTKASLSMPAVKCRPGRFRPGSARIPRKHCALGPREASKALAAWKVNVERRCLGDCRAHPADLRISSDHGDQVGAGLGCSFCAGCRTTWSM